MIIAKLQNYNFQKSLISNFTKGICVISRHKVKKNWRVPFSSYIWGILTIIIGWYLITESDHLNQKSKMKFPSFLYEY